MVCKGVTTVNIGWKNTDKERIQNIGSCRRQYASGHTCNRPYANYISGERRIHQAKKINKQNIWIHGTIHSLGSFFYFEEKKNSFVSRC